MTATSRILALAALLYSFPAISADNTWVTIAETDGGKWQIKSGSLEFTSNKSNVAIAVVIGRTISKKQQIDLYKWYVTAPDCKAGMGQLVSLSLQGEFKFENDFVEDGGNIASAVAEIICGAAKMQIEASEKKGI